MLHSRTLAPFTAYATVYSVSTTLYIVTVSRHHPVLPGVFPDVSRLHLVSSFAVLPACNSVLVCVATFIIATRFSDAKQFGFYPNKLEQQLVMVDVSIVTAVLVMSSCFTFQFRLMCIFSLYFDILISCSMAEKFGTRPLPPF